VSSHLLPTYARVDLAFERGEGAWLYTAQGERYLDFTSGVAVNVLSPSGLVPTPGVVFHGLTRGVTQDRLEAPEVMAEAAYALCTGDPAVLGKPTASDLREGKVTLPVIDVLERQTPGALEIVERIVRGEAGADDGAALTAMLHAAGAIERAEARAREHADLALTVLDGFPDGPARRALQGVPELLISRSR